MTKKRTKAAVRAKKLGLKKETLKDLDSLKGKAAALKGGRFELCGITVRCPPPDTCAN